MNPEASGIIARAEAVRVLPSTRSDFADALERGIMLAQRGEAAGFRLLRETLAGVESYQHVGRDADGEVSLSMYTRGLIDSALWALESPSVASETAAGIERALALIEAGDADGLRLLEDVLD